MRQLVSPIINAAGVQPGQGDNTSPPNVMSIQEINGIASHFEVNAGYSSTGNKGKILPSAISYTVRVAKSIADDLKMEVSTILEFDNLLGTESMMVFLKKYKQSMCQSSSSKLTLIDTVFQDYEEDPIRPGRGRWIDIAADIKYSEEAESVLQAVIQDPSSTQVAATAKAQGREEQAKLGPFNKKGRVILTHICSRLFTYPEMSLDPNIVSSSKLLPLVCFLPYLPLSDTLEDFPVNQGPSITIELQSISGSTILDPNINIVAYAAMMSQFDILFGEENMTVICSSGLDDTYKFSASWACAPVLPTALFFWLSVPNTSEETDLSFITNLQRGSITDGTVEVLQSASSEAIKWFQVNPPGVGPKAQLLRLRVTTVATPLPADLIRIFVTITCSDASGSTSMTVSPASARQRPFSSSTTMSDYSVREALNDLFIIRFLKRLECIPLLVQQGLLRPQDVLVEVVYVFDGSIRNKIKLEFRVGDLTEMDIKAIAQTFAPTASGVDATHSLQQTEAVVGATSIVGQATEFLQSIQKVVPGGSTDFTAPAEEACNDLNQFENHIITKYNLPFDKVILGSFVSFDTDGGHNSAACFRQLHSMVTQCRVMGGVVCGVGS